MVNSEEKMTNLKDSETRVTLGDIIILTRKTHENWHDWQKHDGKLCLVTLKNIAVIRDIQANIFSLTQALQIGFQVTSERKTLILRNKSTEILFDKKMANKAGEGLY